MSAAPAPHRGYKRSQPAPLKVVPPRIRFAHKRKSYAEMAAPIRESKWAPMAPVPTKYLPDFFRVTGSGCTGGLMAMVAHHTFAQPHSLDKPWSAPEWTEPMSDEEWGKLAGNFSRDQAHDSIAYAIQIGMLQRRSEVDAAAPKEAYFQYRWTPGLVWKDLPSAFTPRVEKKPPASETEGEEKATLSGIAIPLAFDKSFRINKAVEASWPETIGSGIAAKLKRPPEDITVTASDPSAQVSTLQVARKLYVHVVVPEATATPSTSTAPQGAKSEPSISSGEPPQHEDVAGKEACKSEPAAGDCETLESAAGAGPVSTASPNPTRSAAESLTPSPAHHSQAQQSPRPAGGLNVVSNATGKVVGELAALPICEACNGAGFLAGASVDPNQRVLPFDEAFIVRLAELRMAPEDVDLTMLKRDLKCDPDYFLWWCEDRLGRSNPRERISRLKLPDFVKSANQAWKNGGKQAWENGGKQAWQAGAAAAPAESAQAKRLRESMERRKPPGAA